MEFKLFMILAFFKTARVKLNSKAREKDKIGAMALGFLELKYNIIRNGGLWGMRVTLDGVFSFWAL